MILIKRFTNLVLQACVFQLNGYCHYVTRVWCRGEEYITFDVAVQMLKRELNLPDDRALKFIKRFDRNNDGRLSMTEFNTFKLKLEEASVARCFFIIYNLIEH